MTQLHDTLAVLAIVALLGSVVLLAARLIPSAAGVTLLDRVHGVQLWLAALVPTVASLGSLYFSEMGNHWTPCRFCWFQRIFMYSSAIVLIVASIRRDRGARFYVAPLAAIGALVSLWHILIERGVVGESSECAASVPCAIPYHVTFGSIDGMTARPTGFPAITLAVMAFCGFAAILALLITPESLEDPHGEPAAG